MSNSQVEQERVLGRILAAEISGAELEASNPTGGQTVGTEAGSDTVTYRYRWSDAPAIGVLG